MRSVVKERFSIDQARATYYAHNVDRVGGDAKDNAVVTLNEVMVRRTPNGVFFD